MPKVHHLLVLIPLVILGPLAVDIFLPALPAMANALSASSTQIQWTVTVYMFSLGLGQLFFGPVSDKIGRKPTLVIGITVYLLAGLAIAFTYDYLIHIVLRGIQGIGACAIVVTTFASVTDKFNEQDSGKIYSYLHGVIFCIPAIAPILGYQLTKHYGWEYNFLLMTILAFITIFFTLRFFQETAPLNAIQPRLLPSIQSYKYVLSKPSFLLHSALVMMSMATIMAFVSTAPNVFVLQYGLTEDVFTFWFSINAATTILISFSVPKLLKHFSLDALIRTGICIVISSGALLLVFNEQSNILSYVLPVIIGTAGFALLLGSVIGKALAPFKAQAGLATALLGFIQMSGSAVIVTLVQALEVSAVMQIVIFSLSFIPLFVLNTVIKEKTSNQQVLSN